MKKSYLIIAFGIALAIFGGVYLGSREAYQVKLNSYSPFTGTFSLVKPVLTKSQLQSILTRDGEFLVLFPQTEIDADLKSRTIKKGTLFVSGYFTNPGSVKKTLDTFNSQEIKYPITSSGIGQIQVESHLIHYGDGSVLIHRNTDKAVTEILAVDHEILFFFNGATEPFVIPPRMMITVSDARVNEKTAQLYYSKLRKRTEFNLNNYIELYTSDDKPVPVGPSIDSPIEKIEIALSKREEEVKKMEVYSDSFIGALQPQKPDSLTSKILDSFREIQSKTAVIRSKKYNDKVGLRKEVENYIQGYYEVADKNYGKASKELDEAKSEIDLETLDRSIDEGFKGEWYDYAKAKSSILRRSLPEDEVYNFYSFWFYPRNASNIENFKSEFYSIQNYIASNNFDNTEPLFRKLKAKIEKINPSSKNSISITHYRRLVTELLKNESYYKNDVIVFENLVKLVSKELKAYESDSLKVDEIMLEVAQDTLYFLRNILAEDGANQEIVKLLEKQFTRFDIAEISKRVGRSQIFSDQELEVIQFLKCAGSTGLTQERIKSCKEGNKKLDFKEKIELDLDLGGNTEDDDDWKKVKNTKDFKSYLLSIGVNASNIKTKNSTNGKSFKFSKIYFDVYRISGIFNYTGQSFETLKIGEDEYLQVGLLNFQRILQALKSQVKNNSTQSVKADIIPQSTPEAKYERHKLQKRLEKEGFRIKISDIEILTKDLERFKVENATSPDGYQAAFIYHKSKDFVSDIQVKYGSSSRSFKQIKYPVSKMRDELDYAILPQK